MAALVYVSVSVIPACETDHPSYNPTVVSSVYAEADVAVQKAQEQVAMLEAKQAVGALTTEESKALLDSSETLNKISTLMQDAKDRAAAGGRTAPDGGDLVQSLTPLLPAPIGIPLGIAVGAISEWARGRKKRVSFDRLVAAIDAVKEDDPVFAGALNVAGPSLRAEMGTATKELVNKTRKTNGS